MIQLPGVGWKLLACENGASPDCIVVVVAVAAVAAVAAAVAFAFAVVVVAFFHNGVYGNIHWRLITHACAESPGSKTPGDSGTPGALEHSQL